MMFANSQHYKDNFKDMNMWLEASNSSHIPVVPPQMEVWGVALECVVLSVIFCLGLTGNGLICLVFFRRPHLLTVSHGFVLNLACCSIGKNEGIRCIVTFSAIKD